MLISEFAREAGLSVDTVRFYIRKGLLMPDTGLKGGSNPYQIFTRKHVDDARTIRAAQLLGFSLKEIAAFAAEYHAGTLTRSRGADVMRAQIAKLSEKADQLAVMIAYMRAKLGWIEAGGIGPEPRFGEPDRPAGRKSGRLTADIKVGRHPKTKSSSAGAEAAAPAGRGVKRKRSP